MTTARPHPQDTIRRLHAVAAAEFVTRRGGGQLVAPARQKLLLMLLVLHEREPVSIKTLCAWIGCANSAVSCGLRALEDQGLIHRTRGRGAGPGSGVKGTTPNLYAIRHDLVERLSGRAAA